MAQPPDQTASNTANATHTFHATHTDNTVNASTTPDAANSAQQILHASTNAVPQDPNTVSPDSGDNDGESDTAYVYEPDELDVDLTELELNPHWDLDDFIEQYPRISEDDLEEYWSAFRWEHSGMLHIWFESSYLYPIRQPRCETVHIVDYERCTPKELKRFVNDRGLQDPYPVGVTLKYYYIRILQRADRHQTFRRFTDLPPELRTWVYAFLLTLVPKKAPQYPGRKHCHPNILRTCRQINREAKCILYDDNAIDCLFERTEETHETASRYCTINGEQIWYELADDLRLNFPEYLLRCSHLSIIVRYGIECCVNEDGTDFVPLNHMLCALASFLMERHNLRKLDVGLDIDMDVLQLAGSPSPYKMILYPLRRLRDIDQVRFFSYDDEFPSFISWELSKDMGQSTDMDRSALTLNTMKYWDLLEYEGYAWENTSLRRNGSDWDILHPIQLEVMEQMETVQEMVCFAYASAEDERRFRSELADLRKLFDKAPWENVVDASQTLAQRRAARVKFEKDPHPGARFKDPDVQDDHLEHALLHQCDLVDWLTEFDD